MGRNKALIAPEYEIIGDEQSLSLREQIHTGGLIPIYSATAGISSKWLRRRIHDAWKRYENDFGEFLPERILKQYDLVDFQTAVHDIHFPESMEKFEIAKKRLAFNELLELHGKNISARNKWDANKIKRPLKINKTQVDDFIATLPFELTLSQTKVVNELLTDLQKDIPMNRLLEGDVGSGKTVVAAVGAYAVFLANKKTVVMAPTQILANQHFNTLKSLFGEKMKVGLWTAQTKTVEEFDVLVGTHALLNAKSKMRNVSLIVIDEHHKFGVKQREKLVARRTPHVLTMTATPIPRTVALTFFGDMMLSVLDELPKGRQKITTWVIPKGKRKGMYNWLETQMAQNNNQIFVVCPLIETSEAETMQDVRGVKREFEKLEKLFPKRKIGLLHGKLKAKEKDEVIHDFKDQKINILVATAVVEVGIDIPNATIMVIEAADRFGLASLHQLRGRVGRGSKKSYCLLMTENDNERTQLRLNAVTKISSGFELAELDLALRGPGEIYGSKQSGIPELKIADWNNLEMIKSARQVAEDLISKN